METEAVANEFIKPKDKKSSWTQEDDAYCIYAFQVINGIPVFHEQMSIARQFAYDTPINASVQAIYSVRGYEQLKINPVYDLRNVDKTIRLMY